MTKQVHEQRYAEIAQSVMSSVHYAGIAQFDSLIKRPALFWIGRAFMGYNLLKILI